MGFTSIFEEKNPFDQSPRVLQLPATLIDEVIRTYPPLVEGIDDVIFIGWLKVAKETFREAGDIEERFAVTIVINDIRGASAKSVRVLKSDQCLTNFKRWASAIAMDVERPKSISEEKWINLRQNPVQNRIDTATKYGYKALEMCRYRSFFITKSGRIGIGPAQISTSSAIYLIRGLTTPFLLEKAPEGNDHHYLREECYVERLIDYKNRSSEDNAPIYLV